MSHAEHPQTDIVMPVHGALDYLRPCVESIFDCTKNFRFIFVDDYSDLETTAFLLDVLKRQPIALYVRTGQQKWFTRASNIGLRLVRTQKCILINSDCVVGPEWLDELHSVWADSVLRGGYDTGLVGCHLSEEEERRWGTYQEPGYVTGHCLLLDIPLLDVVATKRGSPGWYFDELTPDAAHINSDRYLSYEMNRAGYAAVASFKAPVGHHGGKSWGYDLGKVYRIRVGDPQKGEVLG